jgi:integrase
MRGGIRGLALLRRDDNKISKTFRTESEAKPWRAEAKRSWTAAPCALRAKERSAKREKRGSPARTGARSAAAPAVPSSPRRFAAIDRLSPTESCLRFGHCKVSALTTSDLQKLVDDWQAEGRAASTIRNYLRPLQAIYRRARAREGVPVNPTRDLELPVPERREVEIVTPSSAATLLAVLPNPDRAIWATALYAGLRSGELRALRWEAVDVAKRIIEVRESWDPKEGSIEPKTRRSRRRVPVPSILRELLIAQRARSEPSTESALVFGVDDKTPFQPERLYRNADSVWHHAGIRERLRLHQARHTYASFMIAAGINAKALSSFMGHASITVTFDLYGHLMPGSEAEGAALLDAYLDGRSKDIEETDE